MSQIAIRFKEIQESSECEELKPCPFCGSGDVEFLALDDKAPYYSVWCLDCEAEGPKGRNRGGVIVRWNQRINDPVFLS